MKKYVQDDFLDKALLFMRWTTILFAFIATTAFSVLAEPVTGQDLLLKKVTIQIKALPLPKALEKISAVSGVKFTYTGTVANSKVIVNTSAKDIQLKTLLDDLFRDYPYGYEVFNDEIIIRYESVKEKSINKSSEVRPNVPVDIRGKVTDEKGLPLQGVTITVKGTQIVLLSDASGYFIVQTLKPDAVLVFSYVGYKTLEIPVRGHQELSIKMTQDYGTLDQVQVIGYGSTTKRLNTGSVSTINSGSIAEQVITNPLEALEGRVPGLLVTPNSGLPGDGMSVRIRGLNSIAASNNPLYVVDGVPFTANQAEILGAGSPINSISPTDIESIDVLKDADATAIYGSRASNGVIMITTKKAKPGKATLDVSVNSGISTPSRRDQVLSLAQYLQVRNDGMTNSGVAIDAGNSPDLTTWSQTTGFDWQKWYMGNIAHHTDATASYKGSTDQTTFLLSGTYHRENTVQSQDNIFDRADVHINLDHHSADKRFRLQFNSFFDDNSNNRGDGKAGISLAQAVTNIPNYPTFNPNGSYNWYSTNLIAQATSFQKSQTTNLNSNLNLSYLLLPGLNIKSSFGFNRIQNEQLAAYPSTYYDPSTGLTGRSVFTNQYIQALLVEPQITYDRRIAKGDLQLLLGSTVQDNHTQSRNMDVEGYTSDLLLENPGYGTATYPYGSDIDYRYISVFGRLNYNWQDKYLLNATFRRDGSSRFGPNDKFGNFGSIGAAWIFSEESFIKNGIPILSYGKLRGSWGTTGNDGIGDYQYLSTYKNTNLYGNLQTIIPSRIANNNYSWEVNRKLELAMDLGFINDRLLLSMSWYRNRSSNQLVGFPLPAITGFSSYIANLPALVQNTGWEFELNTVNIKSSSFQWKSAISLTLPKNKLLRYDGLGNSTYANSLIVGQPLNVVLGYHFTGVTPQTGLAQVQDANNDGRIVAASSYNNQEGDYINMGQTTPNWYGGLSNTVKYKGFQVDVFIQYAKQKGYNNYSYNYSNFGYLSNAWTDYLGYWKKPGDIVSLPKPTYNYEPTAYNFQVSDAGFTDASYLRFKTIALSYNFPDMVLHQLRISNLRLFLQAQNYFTITSFKGYDPELAGNKYLNVPTLKSMELGLQCSF